MDAVWDFFVVKSIVAFRRWTQSLERIHPMSPSTASRLIQQSISLATFDGMVHEVEGKIAILLPILSTGQDLKTVSFLVGASMRVAIDLPSEVGSSSLTVILDYLRFFQAPGRSDEEIRKFFSKFWIFSTSLSLCELLTAARSLDVSPLVDLTTCSLLRMIGEMTAEEFSEAFHLTEDRAAWEHSTQLPQYLTEKENLEQRNRLINELVAWKRGSLDENKTRKNAPTSFGISSAAVDWHDNRGSPSVDIFLYLMADNGPDGEGNGEENCEKEWKSKTEKKNLKKKEQAKFLRPPKGLNSPENGRVQNTDSTEDTLQSTEDVRNGQEAETIEETEDADEEYASAVSERERLEEIDYVMEEFFRSVNTPWSERMKKTWAQTRAQIWALASYVQETNRKNYILPLFSSAPPSHISQDEHASSSSHAVQIDIGEAAAQNNNGEVAVRNDNREAQAQINNRELATASNREVAVRSDNGEVQAQNNNGEIAAADNREVAVRNDHEEVAPQTEYREVADQNDNREDEIQNDKYTDSDADQSQDDSLQDEIESDYGEEEGQSDYRELAIRAGGSSAEEAQRRNSPTETESSSQCNEFWSCCFWLLAFAFLLVLGFLLWGNY